MAIDDRAGPRWLTHHDVDHLDRCSVIAGVHVCRRCAVLYPLAVLSALAVLVLDPPVAPLMVALWVLPLPMVAEWTGEHLGRLRYSPRRQVVVTALGAPALGIALALHALDPFTARVVLPIAVWIAVCLATAILGRARRQTAAGADWQERHEHAERRRRAELERLLAASDRARDST